MHLSIATNLPQIIYNFHEFDRSLGNDQKLEVVSYHFVILDFNQIGMFMHLKDIWDLFSHKNDSIKYAS